MRPDITSLTQLEATVKDWACLARPCFEIFATVAFHNRDLNMLDDVNTLAYIPASTYQAFDK
jgi:hypothetical protein